MLLLRAFRVSLFCSIVLHISCQDIFEANDPAGGMNTDDNFTDENLIQAHAEMDANSNKEVSREELLDFTEAHHKSVSLVELDVTFVMERADADKNGFVNLEEHLKDTIPVDVDDLEKRKQRIEDETALFNAADANNDGQLNKDELGALLVPETNAGLINITMQQAFRDADTDGNGKLTEKEFLDSMWESWHGKSIEQQFKRLDVNSDGTISQEELRPLMSGRIDREDMVDELVGSLDKDGDAHIDASELVLGKSAVRDSDFQSYLVAWARRRQVHVIPTGGSSLPETVFLSIILMSTIVMTFMM